MEEKLKELWREANAHRDFELSHLWQRSILLTALIVVICTSYAGLVSKFLDVNVGIDKIVLNEIAGFVTLVGLVFSLVWVMMGKGSKSWFEIQEERIKGIEKKLFGADLDGYKMGDDCSLENIDANIFTTNAGKYSVSRLNIFIGIAMSIIWIVLFAVHFVKVINLLDECSCAHCWIAMSMIILFLAIFITAICNVWARSSSLEKKK